MVSHRDERETRVTGDKAQGTIERERRLGGYDAVLKYSSSQLSMGMTTFLSSFSIFKCFNH